MAYFTWHNALKVNPCHSMCQNFLPFWGRETFHCVNTPYFFFFQAIHLMCIWVVFIFWLLYIMLLWTCLYMCIYTHWCLYEQFSILLGVRDCWGCCNKIPLSAWLVVQSLSRVQLFVTPWTAARQDSLSITNSQSLLNLMSIISPYVVPFFSCPQSFPVSGSFPVSQFFPSGGQSTGVSASALPMNIQSWFPCCPRDSQESSPTPEFKSMSSSALSFLYGPTLTSIHDYWKNHSFD